MAIGTPIIPSAPMMPQRAVYVPEQPIPSQSIFETAPPMILTVSSQIIVSSVFHDMKDDFTVHNIVFCISKHNLSIDCFRDNQQ